MNWFGVHLLFQLQLLNQPTSLVDELEWREKRVGWFGFVDSLWVMGGATRQCSAKKKQTKHQTNKAIHNEWADEWNVNELIDGSNSLVKSINEWQWNEESEWSTKQQRLRGKPTPAPINLSLWRRLMELAAVVVFAFIKFIFSSLHQPLGQQGFAFFSKRRQAIPSNSSFHSINFNDWKDELRNELNEMNVAAPLLFIKVGYEPEAPLPHTNFTSTILELFSFRAVWPSCFVWREEKRWKKE